MSADGFCVSIVDANDRVAIKVRPGATMSGFTRPCAVGPRDDQLVIWSLVTVESFLSLMAPTVSTIGSSAGFVIVDWYGPLLPAATTTTMPLLQRRSTAKLRGSSAGSCVDDTPHER